jgi:hypothetical protein
MSKELKDVLEAVLVIWLVLLLFATAPLWGLPYYIYMKRKEAQ